jgi:hypothetical protein
LVGSLANYIRRRKAASGGDIDDRQCAMRFDDYRRQSIHRAARTGAVPVYVRVWGDLSRPASVGGLFHFGASGGGKHFTEESMPNHGVRYFSERDPKALTRLMSLLLGWEANKLLQ